MKYTLICVILLSLALIHCQDQDAEESGNTVILSVLENGDFVDTYWTSYLQNLGLASDDVSSYSGCLLEPSCGDEYSYLADDGCAYIRDLNGINSVWEVWTICYSTGPDPIVSLQVSNSNDEFVDTDWYSYLQNLGLTSDDVSTFSGCLYEPSCGNEYSYVADDGCVYIRNLNNINSAWEVWSIC